MDLEYSEYKNIKQVTIPPENKRFYIIKEKKLGSGSYGDTYLAVNGENQSEVFACKIIEKERLLFKLQLSDNPKLKSEQILKSLNNELNVGLNLQHENIVTLFDFSETAKNYYFFMEFCQKGTLEQLMKESNGFTEQQAVQIFRQLAAGAKYLFDKNIFHRDIKPANVLINNAGVIKLADFGFCKQLEDSQIKETKQSHTLVGTPYYMAPQILAAKPYGIKCDVWSLGIIFYELLVGHKPWFVEPNAPSEMLLNKIMNNNLHFPSDVKISDEIKQLNLGMLQIKEEIRWSMDQVSQYLANLQI